MYTYDVWLDWLENEYGDVWIGAVICPEDSDEILTSKRQLCNVDSVHNIRETVDAFELATKLCLEYITDTGNQGTYIFKNQNEIVFDWVKGNGGKAQEKYEDALVEILLNAREIKSLGCEVDTRKTKGHAKSRRKNRAKLWLESDAYNENRDKFRDKLIRTKKPKILSTPIENCMYDPTTKDFFKKTGRVIRQFSNRKNESLTLYEIAAKYYDCGF